MIIPTHKLYNGGHVAVEHCVMRVCLVPLEPSAPKFFGFSEFLAGLALMILAWTIADVRYRFRIRCAPIPLRGLTFAIVSSVGVLTLLTDFWRAQGWLVPKLSFFSPASWQALLAGSYFLTFLVWVIFAFIKPANFSKWNSKRYAETLFGVIVKGSPTELAVVADELSRSARMIVSYATERPTLQRLLPESARNEKKVSKIEAYANDTLSLIADKRFCRAVVESSPGAAWAFFHEMKKQGKYGIGIQTFASNIVSEALENKDSFLYHETAGYESGLIGSYKPLCQSIFANYEMVEAIETVLDTDFANRSKWDSDQWEAYCRVVIMTFRDYIERGNSGHSYVLYRAFHNIKNATMDLYKLNGIGNSSWDDDLLARLRVVVEFISEAVEVLEKKGLPANLKRREKRKGPNRIENIYDRIANLIYETIFAASSVNSPKDLCWWVQHNALWGELFNFDRMNGPAGEVVKSKVFRLLYDDVLDMERFPNFKGARILSYCLNVMGLQLSKESYYKDSRALHKAILIWIKKNFAWLHSHNPRIAEACLVEDTSYDVENRRIVKVYPVEGLRRSAHHVYLNVDPPRARTEGP